MRRLLGVLLFFALAFAVSPQALLERVQAYLEEAPWQARVVGVVRTPDGSKQTIDFVLKALPKAKVSRIEFNAPGSVADNVVVITPKKVYNYLFLTNQLVVYPRERAKIEGLGVSLSGVADWDALAQDDRLEWRFLGKKTTPKGPAYVLEAQAKDPLAVGFSRLELWVLEEVPRPYRVRVWDAEGELVMDVSWTTFARVPLKKEALLDFPPDAEVIER